jgi:hypothetical protein
VCYKGGMRNTSNTSRPADLRDFAVSEQNRRWMDAKVACDALDDFAAACAADEITTKLAADLKVALDAAAETEEAEDCDYNDFVVERDTIDRDVEVIRVQSYGCGERARVRGGAIEYASDSDFREFVQRVLDTIK